MSCAAFSAETGHSVEWMGFFGITGHYLYARRSDGALMLSAVTHVAPRHYQITTTGFFIYACIQRQTAHAMQKTRYSRSLGDPHMATLKALT